MNYIDLLIIVAVALFLYMGYLRGFIRNFIGLLVLFVAITLASAVYMNVGNFISQIFALPAGFTGTVGFFVVWFVVEILYFGLMIFFYDRIPERVVNSKYNKWAGLVPGLLKALFFIWFTVNLAYLLTISGPLKKELNGSLLARELVKSNQIVGSFLTDKFGPAAAETVSFLTVKPQSGESVSLGYTTANVKIDTVSTKEMLVLVNKERAAHGLSELVFDEALTKVGEKHCADMFARGYFSHNTPEGKTPFDRMDAAKIMYLIAGENLALAPTVEEAFAGLMDSPGHKANMLSTDFGRIGISVVDGGIYGKMFAQEFTN